MDDENFMFEAPVGPHGLREICDENDDGRRNWYVTLAYWDLARVTAAYTHGLGAAAARNGAANTDEFGREGAVSGPAAVEAWATAIFTEILEAAEPLVSDTIRSRRAVTAVRSDAGAVKRAAPNSPPMIVAGMARLVSGSDAARAVANDDRQAQLRVRQRPLNANFCTFATWSSLTLGRDIRNVRLPRRFDRLSGLRLRYAATNLVIEARKTNNMELSRLLGLGQRVVLWEVGTGLYSMFLGQKTLDEQPSVEKLKFSEFAGQRGFTDAATQELGDVIEDWLTSTVRPRGAAGLKQLRSKDLALGLASYHLARRAAIEGGEANAFRGWVAELILRGNLFIGAYEQRKVDQLLKYPIEDFASEFFLDRSGIEGMERTGEGRWRRRLDLRVRRGLTHVPELWGRFFTDQIMVLWAGDELLRLGRDLPVPPGATTFVPSDLENIKDDWLRMLLCRYDHSYGNGHGTQSRIWSVFDDRMNYIVNFMRSRAQTPGLWQDPFEPSEARELRNGTTLRSEDDPAN